MNYETHGPFEVKRSPRLVDRSAVARREFWKTIDEEVPGLSYGVGCYIFCIGDKPWYVGLAEKQSFRSECFQPHKINAFNSALDKARGTPNLILIAKITPKKRLAKPGVNGHKATRFLEDLLIGMALSRNPRLENIRGTKFPKNVVVPGIINTPHGKHKSKSVQFLREIMKS